MQAPQESIETTTWVQRHQQEALAQKGGRAVSWRRLRTDEASSGVAGLSPGRKGLTAASGGSSTILLFGGEEVSTEDSSPASTSSSIIAFETARNQWTSVAAKSGSLGQDGPERRADHTVCASEQSSLLYFFGGRLLSSAGGGALAPNDLDIFDTRTRTWSRESMQGYSPPARRLHSAELVGNQIYIFGGVDASGALCAPDMYTVDLASKMSIMVFAEGPEPEARAGHTCTLVGHKLFIIGGTGPDGHYMESIHVLDTAALVWAKVDVPHTPQLAFHSAAAVDGHTIVLFGGEGPDGQPQPDLHFLDTEAMEWSAPHVSGVLPSGRSHHAWARSHGKLFLFGGANAVPLHEVFALTLHEGTALDDGLTGGEHSLIYLSATEEIEETVVVHHQPAEKSETEDESSSSSSSDEDDDDDESEDSDEDDDDDDDEEEEEEEVSQEEEVQASSRQVESVGPPRVEITATAVAAGSSPAPLSPPRGVRWEPEPEPVEAALHRPQAQAQPQSPWRERQTIEGTMIEVRVIKARAEQEEETLVSSTTRSGRPSPAGMKVRRAETAVPLSARGPSATRWDRTPSFDRGPGGGPAAAEAGPGVGGHRSPVGQRLILSDEATPLVAAAGGRDKLSAKDKSGDKKASGERPRRAGKTRRAGELGSSASDPDRKHLILDRLEENRRQLRENLLAEIRGASSAATAGRAVELVAQVQQQQQVKSSLASGGSGGSGGSGKKKLRSQTHQVVAAVAGDEDDKKQEETSSGRRRKSFGALVSRLSDLRPRRAKGQGAAAASDKDHHQLEGGETSAAPAASSPHQHRQPAPAPASTTGSPVASRKKQSSEDGGRKRSKSRSLEIARSASPGSPPRTSPRTAPVSSVVSPSSSSTASSSSSPTSTTSPSSSSSMTTTPAVSWIEKEEPSRRAPREVLVTSTTTPTATTKTPGKKRTVRSKSYEKGKKDIEPSTTLLGHNRSSSASASAGRKVEENENEGQENENESEVVKRAKKKRKNSASSSSAKPKQKHHQHHKKTTTKTKAGSGSPFPFVPSASSPQLRGGHVGGEHHHRRMLDGSDPRLGTASASVHFLSDAAHGLYRSRSLIEAAEANGGFNNSAEQALLEGWLTKRDNKSGAWKVRWCRLLPSSLHFYKDETTPLGSIGLAGARLRVDCSEDDVKKGLRPELAFVLTRPKERPEPEPTRFVAKSAKQKRKWVEALLQEGARLERATSGSRAAQRQLAAEIAEIDRQLAHLARLKQQKTRLLRQLGHNDDDDNKTDDDDDDTTSSDEQDKTTKTTAAEEGNLDVFGFVTMTSDDIRNAIAAGREQIKGESAAATAGGAKSSNSNGSSKSGSVLVRELEDEGEADGAVDETSDEWRQCLDLSLRDLVRELLRLRRRAALLPSASAPPRPID